MGYRNIQVNGETYRYIVGFKYVKFFGGKLVNKEDIGQYTTSGKLIVTPGFIKYYILNGKKQEKFHCRCGKDALFRPLPFDVEIYNRLIYRFICQECYELNADNI